MIPSAEKQPRWENIPGLVHRFYGRRGGNSAGEFASLNLSEKVGDSPANVTANWTSVQRDLRGFEILRLEQIHGADIVVARKGSASGVRADGMITDDNGVALAILTADCVPILLVAARRHIAMALHAGWRGTLAGIAAAAVQEAAELFGVAPNEWQAALGPAIGGCCYEVSREIGDRLTDRWGDMADAWETTQDHGNLDLRIANRHILEGAGVPATAIADVGSCTSCHPDLYFSHRASGGRAGRQLSVIGWRDQPIRGSM